jgi:membrane protease YdiL (CAAX protease family)
MYGSFGSDILPWVLLAVSAGVAEEVLFRGALQPRLGLLLTSLLFTATHLQYGLSIVLAVILLGGLSLGLLRKYANTTTAILCHVTYDLLAGLPFPYWWLFIALGVQLPLLVFYAIRHRASLRSLLTRILRGRQQPQPALPTVAGPA